MKLLLIIFLGVLCCSCKQNRTQVPLVENLEINTTNDLNWLIGDWVRTGEKEGNKTYEYWKQNSDNEYVGMGCTLQGRDTIWKEDILLKKGVDGWAFEVIGIGDSISTIFLLTELGKDKFICVNDSNEFPKRIEYAFDGNHINAIISGGGPTIPFQFEKMKQ